MTRYTFVLQQSPKYVIELNQSTNKFNVLLRSAIGPTGPKGDKGERGNDGIDGTDGLQEQEVINIIENTTIDGGNF